jgi:hypothetical protein
MTPVGNRPLALAAIGANSHSLRLGVAFSKSNTMLLYLVRKRFRPPTTFE